MEWKRDNASQSERLGRSCVSITRSALSLARSAQAERDNESCFFHLLKQTSTRATWLPPPIVARKPRRITSALPTSRVGTGCQNKKEKILWEGQWGVGGRSGPPKLSLGGGNTTAEAVTSRLYSMYLTGLAGPF
ncbi:hypothetical protein EVAR_10962_1 [Eumeta japonica]|uniref:Uncharacterized protein n=1 Tax=Eumeta variegata TaxID=151549 RepID=A0A4C1U5Z2_EUMVA|nr:hypothetical protein EVAR_10962_1 [Eumeta japonica]